MNKLLFLYNYYIRLAAFSCNNNQPWAVNNNLAYGFAGAYIEGQDEPDWCCGCYELTFTTGPVVGKRMIVQVTNTGELGVCEIDFFLNYFIN